MGAEFVVEYEGSASGGTRKPEQEKPMRILFNSRQTQFKDPFGTLKPGQVCTLHIHIPLSVAARTVTCDIMYEDGRPAIEVAMTQTEKMGAYAIFRGEFAFSHTGLYFYRFRITGKTGTFRLFRQGDSTNMEAGDLWQVSCVPADFTVPQWAKGATIYQVFPDRFRKSGDCDLTGKLTPYTVHKNWNEEVQWQPDENGIVQNNDFFGGNFRGITEKLDYIASLGVTILYLNPISKSFSHHRYDTGDYKTVDPMLGTEADFTALCQAAHARGIRVILDGVFNHTGSNSLYFNRDRQFPGAGAYHSKRSPYYNWYQFKNYPNSYDSWWGFDTLPTVNKMDPAFIEYIITGKDSVIEHWLNAGCDGFRLDVADELPPEFLDILKKHLRKLRPDALLMGEVWEDASNKVAYGRRCRYFVDGCLDSVMNYPFRTAILNYLRKADSGEAFKETVLTILENYPRDVVDCNMNLLGTHDTMRILTALTSGFDGSRAENAAHKLSHQQYAEGVQLLRMASLLQYTLPGSPSLYYGDEAGLEGCKDPFNRRTFPWGKENPMLQLHFRQLGALRQAEGAIRLGDIQFFRADSGMLGFTRSYNGRRIHICVNRGSSNWVLPGRKILLQHELQTHSREQLVLPPMGWCVLEGV